MTEQIVAHLGYVGIALILILGGLGLPIPEEAPVILAAVLSRNGKLLAPLAVATCLLGVLAGDFVVYFLGYFYGEKVLSLPLTRRLLTRARSSDQGVFSPSRVQDPGAGTVRGRLSNGRLSHRGDLEATAAETLAYRPACRLAEHLPDVRPGIHLCPPDPERNPRDAAVVHSGPGGRSGDLAILPLLRGAKEGRPARRPSRAFRRRAAPAPRRPEGPFRRDAAPGRFAAGLEAARQHVAGTASRFPSRGSSPACSGSAHTLRHRFRPGPSFRRLAHGRRSRRRRIAASSLADDAGFASIQTRSPGRAGPKSC